MTEFGGRCGLLGCVFEAVTLPEHPLVAAKHLLDVVHVVTMPENLFEVAAAAPLWELLEVAALTENSLTVSASTVFGGCGGLLRPQTTLGVTLLSLVINSFFTRCDEVATWSRNTHSSFFSFRPLLFLFYFTINHVSILYRIANITLPCKIFTLNISSVSSIICCEGTSEKRKKNKKAFVKKN
jgi:hypothetical protein